MERLTEHHFKKTDGFYMKCSEHCCKEDFSCEDCTEFDKLVDRLGTIEDILGDEYDLDRLRELVEADRDGRCVVFPQKTVFELAFEPGEYCDMVCPLTIDGVGQCYFCDFGVETVRECNCRQEHIERIGKDVFLTREAAEAALKGEMEDENG